MEKVKEREPRVLSEHINPEQKRSEEISIRPPEPLMTVIYRNGQGNRIEEEVTLSSFDEAGIKKKISEEIETLRRRLELIPSKLQEIPKKKRKHGGRLIAKDKQTQRRERLVKEEKGIPNKITHRKGMIKQLREILTSSDPFEPVQLEVVRAKIRIQDQEGKILSPEDQEWWRYLREEAPEIWRHIESSKKELFQILYGVFIRRLDRRWATGEEKKEADDEFYRFIIEEVGDEEYNQIKEDLKKITRHFTENH